MRLLTALLVVIITSCGSMCKKTSTSTSKVEEKVQKTDFTIVYEGYEHYDKLPQVSIYKNAEDLQKAWTIVNITRRPGLPMPKFKSSSERIVILNRIIETDLENNSSLEIKVSENMLIIAVEDFIDPSHDSKADYFKNIFKVLKVESNAENVKIVN